MGIDSHPYLDLSAAIDTSSFAELHEEICLGLAHVPLAALGGKHKSWKIVPPEVAADPYRDFTQVIRDFTEREYERFLSLGYNPAELRASARDETEFGEGGNTLLSPAQLRYLRFRHGVYFPWRAGYCLRLGENQNWYAKHSSTGRYFSEEAKKYFPKTIRFIESLPFEEIGRADIFGVDPYHHVNIHHDEDPVKYPFIDECINFCPDGRKELFLYNAKTKEKLPIRSKIYWFNNTDFHGVDPKPFFQVSIRVDGVFTDAFLESLTRTHGVRIKPEQRVKKNGWGARIRT